MSLYGVASFAQHARQNLQFPVGDRGFRENNATQAAIDFLRSVDRGPEAASTVIYVPSKEMGLEFRRARFIAVPSDFTDKEVLATHVFHGRVPRLYVLLSAKLIAEGKGDMILKSFVDYPAEAWTKVPLGEFTYFFADR